ncbi:MAG: hypothetical protein M2R45_04585 [Verrucomicrobia subdivision 3 bacterium]|nr:hypothetical protein [Limisphaerales bacterium]MCS1417360.1 hypothetical protein [Limisphaerales bacterium]
MPNILIGWHERACAIHVHLGLTGCAGNRHTLIMGMYPSSTEATVIRTWKRTSALHLITDPALLGISVYEAMPPAEAR